MTTASQSMDVLQVNKFFYEKGGAERYFFSVSRALAERGHRLTHFSMLHPRNFLSPYDPFFVDEQDYRREPSAGGLLTTGLSFIRSRQAARRLAALIAAHPPDIAHFHNIYHQITPSIIPVLKRAGVPMVMTLHDYKLICPNYCFFARGSFCDRCLGGRFHQAAMTRCNNGSFRRSLLLTVEAYYQKWSGVYQEIDLFLAPSRYIRDLFIRAGFEAERIRYLRSYVSAKEHSAAGGGDEEKLDGLTDDYVLYFGRLSGEKGIGTLLDAMALNPGVPLVLAGDGPEADLLKARAEAQNLPVTFLGFVERPRLDEIIRRSRMVVQPSEWPENAPFTVLEAAFHGVPVIVSDMGGLPEQVELLGGAVFRCGDAAGLADRIAALWSDPGECRRIGAGAAEAMKRYYNQEMHLAELEKVYRELTGGSPPAGES
jgi:glycosyltransferase involved in cell wall biosynthesis